MRPDRIHQGQDGCLFAVTTTTLNRQPIFQNPECAEIVIEVMKNYRKRGDFMVAEYVIMPDHIHLIICPKKISLSQCMHHLKRTIAQEINKKFPNQFVGPQYWGPTIRKFHQKGRQKSSLWQPSFYENMIRNQHHLSGVRNYLYMNPVNAGLCRNPDDYPYSSIHRETDRNELAIGLGDPNVQVPLFLATTNQGKIIEIRESLKGLKREILSPLDWEFFDDQPEETGDTFEANALQKARFYHQYLNIPTLADDSGIMVEALANELGIHTRRWGAGKDASDHHWITYFLERMRREENKRARFICVLAYIDERGTEHLFEGTCDGVITDELEADYLPGLPISACFKPDGFDKVYSALSIDQKNAISHRGRAMHKFRAFLEESTAQ